MMELVGIIFLLVFALPVIAFAIAVSIAIVRTGINHRDK